MPLRRSPVFSLWQTDWKNHAGDDPGVGRSRRYDDARASEAARPKRIILFGSRARGESRSDSDFDVMVVEERPANRFAEMDIPVDLLVVSEEKFQYWRDTPGNVCCEAAVEGRTLYEAA